ncbi:hypothetical protein [Polycladidibacter stylochi]|uniref:hypothetical protein n=1 Tax=Polycladidibacter stylochi TaxID=1807766 RepID=UPI0012E3F1FD|nr:hypothetical protein [Pseudovibrio stylochi]
MRQVLHGSATATHAIRVAFQRTSATILELAKDVHQGLKSTAPIQYCKTLVQVPIRRRRILGFENTISIGLKSEEFGGWNRNQH